MAEPCVGYRECLGPGDLYRRIDPARAQTSCGGPCFRRRRKTRLRKRLSLNDYGHAGQKTRRQNKLQAIHGDSRFSTLRGLFSAGFWPASSVRNPSQGNLVRWQPVAKSHQGNSRMPLAVGRPRSGNSAERDCDDQVRRRQIPYGIRKLTKAPDLSCVDGGIDAGWKT
jgi:hypothetical protein